MTQSIAHAVRARMTVAKAEQDSGLGTLDARSRDIVYFVAVRELTGTETTVSHIILNDSFGSLGTVQRHLYALIADRWLEAHESPEDARRKNIRLGLLSRRAFAKMSELLQDQFRAEAGPEVADDR